MIGRIFWYVALVGIAIVTTGLQIDKQAESNAALAKAVPEPLRNFAQTQVTLNALASDDADAALAEAVRLVRRRPVPAEYLTLLATAQAKAGKAEQAAITIQIAGQRGWRDQAAQEATLRLALAAGDKAEAARRYAALFRGVATPDTLLIDLGQQVLDEPGGAGRSTLAGVIAGADRWHTMFLQRGTRVMPADAFAEVVVTAADGGARFECEALKIAAEGVRQRDARAATQLAPVLQQSCPS